MTSAVATLALGTSAISPTLRSTSHQADILTEYSNAYPANQDNISNLSIPSPESSLPNTGLSTLASAASAPTSYPQSVPNDPGLPCAWLNYAFSLASPSLRDLD
ncbi:hypothetical protein PRK78_002743 [Emydomyces testavorans]|uniref:Uncharacterized protein n=1 Tax=Emydomyces testavorans TaxID=2070801 RepID=A0AAF0DFG9_9EURO|nr:hypothetical protein PRK78_002743 [Emydomyces testavorans]